MSKPALKRQSSNEDATSPMNRAINVKLNKKTKVTAVKKIVALENYKAFKEYKKKRKENPLLHKRKDKEAFTLENNDICYNLLRL